MHDPTTGSGGTLGKDIIDSIGPYRISREIGRGGMGVVYLARDTKLDRDVAIKALPPELAEDADRLARFQHEAKTLAQLNHSNVAGIYGVEEQDGQRYLILEFVEGETLGDRIDRGPIPVDEAIELAVGIAAGIEAAHDAGVIHRDLKPDNIKITPYGQVKVLDFGLAKVLGETTSGSDIANSPTIVPVRSPTVTGMIMGTAGYLSPEQARGRPVDKRSDIFSFGCVLYEMLTGETPFAGETVSDSIAATLKTDPDFDRLPTETPVMVRHVLKRCLARDRNRRLCDIGDARLELQAAQLSGDQDAAVATVSRRSNGPLVAAVLILGMVIGGLSVWFGADRTAPVAAVKRFEIDLQREGALSLRMGPNFAISPDGKRIAYILQRDEVASLYVRELDAPEGRSLLTGPILEHPFFSPDGQWIGYFTNDNLLKVAISGGSPIELADALGGRSRGGTWGPSDTIVFTPDTTSPLMRVSATGGPVEALTTLDSSRQERSHRWPAFVPGHADRIVFTSQTLVQGFDETSIEMLDLSAGTRHVLHEHGSYGRVTPDGQLLFALRDTLFGCPLTDDLKTPARPPVPIVSELNVALGNGGAQYAFSDTGLMIYILGAEGRSAQSMPTWVDFDGVETPLFPEPTNLFYPAISPDGGRIAFHEDYGNTIVIYEIRRGLLTPAYPSEDGQFSPVWSPDGMRLAFGGQTEERMVPSLLSIPLDGETAPAPLAAGTLMAQTPSDWSHDGTMVLFNQYRPDTRRDIHVCRVETGDVETVIASRGEDQNARFSPKDDWIVYQSDSSGTDEIYLRRLEGAGTRLQLSVGGGGTPRWAPDGLAVYYLMSRATMAGRSATLMRVAVDLSTDPPTIGTAEPALASIPNLITGEFDIDPSGERVLVLKEAVSRDEESSTRIYLVTNWFEELTRVLAREGGTP